MAVKKTNKPTRFGQIKNIINQMINILIAIILFIPGLIVKVLVWLFNLIPRLNNKIITSNDKYKNRYKGSTKVNVITSGNSLKEVVGRFIRVMLSLVIIFLTVTKLYINFGDGVNSIEFLNNYIILIVISGAGVLVYKITI